MVKKNLTRKDLVNKIFQNLGFSKNHSAKVVDNLFETIINEVLNNTKVKISSFGTFSLLNKKERIGRNPKTLIETKIIARKVVKFKASEIAKKKINKNGY